MAGGPDAHQPSAQTGAFRLSERRVLIVGRAQAFERVTCTPQRCQLMSLAIHWSVFVPLVVYLPTRSFRCLTNLLGPCAQEEAQEVHETTVCCKGQVCTFTQHL